MAEKRPSDRKSQTLTVRLTRTERASIRAVRRNNESGSDTVRRLLNFALILLAKDEALSAGETETRT